MCSEIGQSMRACNSGWAAWSGFTLVASRRMLSLACNPTPAPALQVVGPNWKTGSVRCCAVWRAAADSAPTSEARGISCAWQQDAADTQNTSRQRIRVWQRISRPLPAQRRALSDRGICGNRRCNRMLTLVLNGEYAKRWFCGGFPWCRWWLRPGVSRPRQHSSV